MTKPISTLTGRPKGLSEADIEFLLTHEQEGDEVECDYCGLSIADGDFTFVTFTDGPKAGFTLDQFCVTDEALGACRHGGICDCSDGICE